MEDIIMDEIKEKIEEVVAKLKNDDKLMAQFKTEPVKALEKLLGVDLPDEMIDKIIDGVKAKLAAGDIADKVDDVKDAIGGLFAKFKK